MPEVTAVLPSSIARNTAIGIGNILLVRGDLLDGGISNNHKQFGIVFASALPPG
jgi:hypothetical protein